MTNGQHFCSHGSAAEQIVASSFLVFHELLCASTMKVQMSLEATFPQQEFLASRRSSVKNGTIPRHFSKLLACRSLQESFHA
jgi:hypothetical protein